MGRLPHLSVMSLLSVMLVAGCGQGLTGADAEDLSPGSSQFHGALITPLCQLGCLGPGPDPNPESPGEWIGAEFNDDLCIWGSTDLDYDGLGDLCEFKLIEAFAPQMVTWNTQDGPTAEDIGGERYWAARYVDDGPFAGTVALAYLPAYYYDLGDPETGLTAHVGDSELIVLHVKYHASTMHWVLKAAYLSAHESFGFFNSDLGSDSSFADLEYPVRSGGHPRIWVAKFKHANYGSRSACMDGGFLGADHCDTFAASAKWRFPVYSNHNLGSSAHKFVNCVNAQFRSGWHSECMWATSGKFQGWMYHPDPYNGGNPYGSRLQVFGF